MAEVVDAVGSGQVGLAQELLGLVVDVGVVIGRAEGGGEDEVQVMPGRAGDEAELEGLGALGAEGFGGGADEVDGTRRLPLSDLGTARRQGRPCRRSRSWRTVMMPWSRSTSDQRSARASPMRSPVPSRKASRCSWRWPRAAARSRRACSVVNGCISGLRPRYSLPSSLMRA